MVFAKILEEFGIADKVIVTMIPDEEMLTQEQILSITCDNASCNNVMIAELAKILPNFSEDGHTWCFLHIVNLIAKSIIRQFDVQKKRDDEHLDEAEQELRNLAGDVDLENEEAEEAMGEYQISGEIDAGDETDDDVEGWINEMMLLSPAEHEWVEEDIRPVKLVLVKVRISVTSTCKELHTYTLAASKDFF